MGASEPAFSSLGPETARGDSRPSVGGSRRWLILVFLMGLCFISHFNRASITSAGDEQIMKQYGISPESMGVIYSSFLIVYTLFMIPGGWLIDRRGTRFALACMGLGSALFCIFTGAIGFGFLAATQIWVSLLMVRALMGLFTVPLHPGAARAAGNWFAPAQQALANGLITGASILAYAVVHPVFGSLIDRFDWPIAFVITGSLTALIALAWWFFVTDHPAGSSRLEVQAQAATVRSVSSPEPQNFRRNLILITLSYSAIGYFQYLFFYWLHYYFESILHMDKAESRYLTGLPSLAMAASMPLGGWLTDRIVRWRGDVAARALVPKVGMIVSAVLLACGIFAEEKFWIVACFTASLAVLGLCEAAFWTVAVSLGRERGGTSAAIMNTGGNGIGLLAPMITPWIGTHLGWGWGLGVGAVIGLLGGLCWFGIKLHDSPGANTPPVRQ